MYSKREEASVKKQARGSRVVSVKKGNWKKEALVRTPRKSDHENGGGYIYKDE